METETQSTEIENGNAEPCRDVIAELAALPPGALVSEAGLARILGKCRDSVKAAVERNELPRPVRFFGKPTWCAGLIVRHVEQMLEAEAKKFRQHSV